MGGQLPCSSYSFPSVGHKGKFPELLEFLKGLPEGLYSLQIMVISPNLPWSPPPTAATVLNHFSTTDSSPQTTSHSYGIFGLEGFISFFLVFLCPPPHSQTQQGQRTFIFENGKDFLADMML